MLLSQRQLFLNNVAQTSNEPLMLEVTRAEGNWLYDSDNKKYLDLISGISVSNYGHQNKFISEAIKNQVDKHLHLMVYGEYIQAPQVELSSYLAAKLPKNLSSIYFVNSGSEANEGALKLAKRWTGRHEIIYAKKAYHGSSHGALSIIGDEDFKRNFRPLLPHCKPILFNNKAHLNKISKRTAAVIVETVQGEAGIQVPDSDYMQALRQACTDSGALLILDEIQVGIGRTGSLFAFEQFNIVPDILTLAKAFGAGMPLGAFVSSKQIMSKLTSNPILGHISTFGGHPVSCAASLAGLKFLEENELLKDVSDKYNLFKKLLVHPKIVEFRGKGLFIAIDIGSFEKVKQVIDHCLENGLIVDWFLFNDQSLRIAPPLTIQNEEIHFACKVILEALETLD
ncbi:MAG: aspartate aminotransferase family protein [Flavobacteriales bacterium]|nr:aspartate aminotransferase family protein [Flavobacteriales bacterium]